MSGSIVTAQIKNLLPHPDAKKLKLCTVFDGTSDFQIVCGAANAREGMITILAQLGSTLPSGLKIEKASLRGIDSHGMLCSAKELGLLDEGGIIDLSPDTELGKSFDSFSADTLSSIPWYAFEEKEAFWQSTTTKKILITRHPQKPNSSEFEILSKTYWKDGQYFYRHFI